MHTLAHDFLLLSLDDKTGNTLVPNDLLLHSSVAAAWIGEMMFRDRLVSAGADLFYLRDGPLSDALLGKVEAPLVDAKPATLQICMSHIRGVWHDRDLVSWVTDELIADGTLRKERDKIWFIPYNTRHPAEDMAAERGIRARLRAHLSTATDTDAPHRDDALISLLRAASLLTSVWSAAEIEALRPQIVERTKRAPLGRQARDAADAAQAALTAATIIAIT